MNALRVTLFMILFVSLVHSTHAANVDLALESLQTRNDLAYAVLLNNNVQTSTIEPTDTNLSLQFELDTDLEAPGEQTAVRINNLEGTEIDWTEQDQVSFNKEDTFGLDRVVSSVTIDGMDSFIESETYEAMVAFYTTVETPRVFWCHNTCTEVVVCEAIEAPCFTHINDVVSVHVPHFSTILVTESADELLITNPNNTSILSSGEDVVAQAAAPGATEFFFRLNNNSAVNVSGEYNGSHTRANTTLVGSLNGVLANGVHTLLVSTTDDENASVTFTVADSNPPRVEELSGVDSEEIVTNNDTLSLVLNASEYTLLTMTVNDNLVQELELAQGNVTYISIPVEVGANTVDFSASDMHNNSENTSIDFTITLASSCFDGIQNGDETGVDCGGSCDACVPFLLSTDQSSYGNTDDVSLTIEARTNSTVNYTVRRDGEVVEQDTITSYSPGFPILYTTVLANTTVAGQYTIDGTMTYLTVVEDKQATFDVTGNSNPLGLTLDVDDDDINEDENVTFTATVTGAPGSITYQWDVFNDSTIENTDESFTYVFPSNGTKVVTLQVFSGGFNRSDSVEIDVHRQFNLTVVVRDSGNVNLPNATVIFDGENEKTDSSGIASFLARTGEYDIAISKSGYDSVINDTNINQDVTHLFKLNETNEDLSGPTISIVSPSNNSQASSGNLVVRFVATDQSSTTCKLHTRTDTTPFTSGSDFSVTSGSESEVQASIREGKNEWRLECRDSLGFTSYSDIFTVTYNASVAATAQAIEFDSSSITGVIDAVERALQSMDGWTGIEQEAMNELQLSEGLRKTKLELSRINRDLYNLKFRKVEEDEREDIRVGLVQKLDDIREETIIDLSVTGSAEFVSYPTDDTLLELMQIYVELTNQNIGEDALSLFLPIVKEIQENMVVTTRTYTMDVTTISGTQKKVTGVAKFISFSEGFDYRDNTTLVEYIPKSIADSVDKVQFLNTFNVIQEDPVLEITNLVNDRVIYFVEGTFDDLAIKETALVLAPQSIDDITLPVATGFSIFKSIRGYLVETDAKNFFIQILVILALLPVAGYYLLVPPKGKKKTKKGKSKGTVVISTSDFSKSFNELVETIEESHTHLKNGSVDQAKENYRHIQNLYRVLGAHERKHAMPKIRSFKGHIDAGYLKRQLMKAEFHIEDGAHKKAKAIYKNVCKLYKELPKHHKKEVHQACTKLHAKF